ncbi:mannose-1-phosphate guanyltransferase [Mitosporidium daphniae]|uniref:mannose-1-phosphate guanylyltransferase n=1 Tax=Mitosporidium daphniae TaxID=1485682 RepID=A0A098VUA2_9MICR|nr:mannose-1-phosphate guanyltransferase [Mitosporidium daphniae]KGG52557.1 mannose-1-phosphate guanyltransferase [Mitosporidium daphniae]|eukprot:XP_013238984.1 mannose-1-phosphate guanyltransferase [Mitosporidium daphniae]
MILHQIEALVAVGVTDIILAVNYRPEIMVAHMKDYESKYNVKITFSVETEPLGTAGPLALAKAIFNETPNESFFVLNSDIICDFPFAKMFHKAHGKEGTILVTRVEEPSKYGVIVTRANNQSDHDGPSFGGDQLNGHAASPTLIDQFVEKPKEFVSNRINAGIYLFTPAILQRIEPKPTSIEKEVFPLMAYDEQLHAFDLDGFWMDVGQPKDYLAGTGLYLNHLSPKLSKQSLGDLNCVGNILVHPTAKIGADCKLGPDVVIGPGVTIGDGVRISRSVIFEKCNIKSHSFVQNSIIGWNSHVGRWSRVEGISILGDDVIVGDEVGVV